MKRKTIFIIEKEAPVANLIRYHLLTQHQARHVQVFPTPEKCLYFMHKKSIPDFLIADLDHPETHALGFLETVMQSFPGIKILFLSPNTDDTLVRRLMEEGATDYIFKSAWMENWIRELVKNMKFLVREKNKVN